MRRGLLVVVLALAVAPAAHAGGPTMLFGATTDPAKQNDPALAQAEIVRAKAAGANSVRLTQAWLPGQTELTATDLVALRNAVFAASVNRMTVVLVISHPGSRTTPLTDEQRTQFATFTASVARAVPYVKHFTIGNEPNLNRFWLPQFGPGGENVAAPAYLRLLTAAYDALKAVDEDLQVLGGALSPRGSDNPTLSRHTHSPTKFIKDMGIAYRASGRTKPVMDALSINPFADNSSISPAVGHPRTTSIGVADYDKLVKLLGEAFDGTGQPGSTLPIYYGEFGVESLPPEAKRSLYNGEEPTTTKPVNEQTQAAYYRKALELAFCQTNVKGLLLFLNVDDADLPGWQSGLFYADKSPKSSLAAVKQAARQTKGGIIAKCPSLKLTPVVDRFGPFGANSRYGVHFRCSVDCTAQIQLQRVPDRKVVGRITGKALAGVYSVVRLPRLKLTPGVHRFVVSFSAPVNPGTTVTKTSVAFSVR